MAGDFDGSSNYLAVDSAPVTGYPFTMAAWAFADAGGTIFSIGDKDTAEHYDGLQHNGTSTLYGISSAGTSSASDGTGFTLSAWHHGACAFASSTSRTCYVDGTAATTDTGSKVPNARDRVGIGVRADSLLGTRFNGRVEHAALWNVTLNATEIKALSRGISPRLIRPGALVFHAPIWKTDSPVRDHTNGVRHLTVTGSPGTIVGCGVQEAWGFDAGRSMPTGAAPPPPPELRIVQSNLRW
jgi:hypothetical protein